MVDIGATLKKIFPFFFSDWQAISGRLTAEEQLLKQQLEALTEGKITTVKYYKTALTHRSSLENNGRTTSESNERLEFLGDAVLDLIVAEFLYKNYESSDEGKLTKLRSQIVNWRSLSDYARQINLGKLLIVSDAAEQIGIRNSDTALADAMESLLGAIYLDGGYDLAQKFVVEKLLASFDFDDLINHDTNYKSALLEFTQAKKIPIPIYFVIDEQGPAHKKLFTIGAKIGDRVLGEGKGSSKKDAEQIAAQEALEKLKSESEPSIESI
jgi:ribonuclease-3